MAGFVDVVFRVNNAAVETGFAKVRQNAARLRTDVVGQFAGAFAVGAIVGSLKSVADEFGRIRDLSERFGESAESIQRVGFAAKQSGADMETIATALGKATVNAAAASGGNEKMVAAFAELNINAAEFVNMSLEDKLVAIASGFEGVTGDGDKLRLAMQVLGKSGADLLPLLKAGPDALKAAMAEATVATQSQIEKMDDLADRLDAMGITVRVGLGGAFVWVADRVEDVGSYIGALIVGTSDRLSKFGGVFSKLLEGDFSGAASAAKEFVTSLPSELAQYNQMAVDEITGRSADREAAKITNGKKISGPIAEQDPAPAGAQQGPALQEFKDYLAAEKEILDLRASITKQEFEKLSKEEQLAVLANEAANLIVDRGDTELETLRRQERLNEVAVEMAQIQKGLEAEKSRNSKEAARAADAKIKAGFKAREDALGFASGAQRTSVDSGLLGVNASVGNIEAQKQVELQQEMASYLKTIAAKEWAVEIPEAE